MDKKWGEKLHFFLLRDRIISLLPSPSPSVLSAPQQQSDGYLYIAGIIIYLWIVNTENYSRVNAIRFTDKLEASINLDYNRN